MALKGPIVTQNADGSFKQPTGKTTLFPKLAKGKNLAQDDQPKTAKAKKSKAKTAKAKKPKPTKTRGPDKKTVEAQDKKTEKPKNGKAIGQRILGLRAEMRTLETKIKKSDQHLKNMRKERREKITALWDIMDNTHQMSLPFA